MWLSIRMSLNVCPRTKIFKCQLLCFTSWGQKDKRSQLKLRCRFEMWCSLSAVVALKCSVITLSKVTETAWWRQEKVERHAELCVCARASHLVCDVPRLWLCPSLFRNVAFLVNTVQVCGILFLMAMSDWHWWASCAWRSWIYYNNRVKENFKILAQIVTWKICFFMIQVCIG